MSDDDAPRPGDAADGPDEAGRDLDAEFAAMMNGLDLPDLDELAEQVGTSGED